MRSVILGLCLAAMAVSPVIAAPSPEQQEAAWCRNGLFPSEQTQIGLAHATGKPRTYFLQDKDSVAGCPDKGAACRQGYVLPGQQVLTSKSLGAFGCAYFPNKVGGSAGWVARSDLSMDKPVDPAPPATAWGANWANGDDTIAITARGRSLSADGAAIYRGMVSVNEGSLSASAIPRGNHVTFAEGKDQDSCRVDATLAGNYLVVTDNSNCGGMNVRFDGVYVRTPAKKH